MKLAKLKVFQLEAIRTNLTLNGLVEGDCHLPGFNDLFSILFLQFMSLNRQVGLVSSVLFSKLPQMIPREKKRINDYNVNNFSHI